ncbi:MAG: hypothetical protein QF441_07615 [Bacteriovoracaceae bacterium]|jgi:Tfp pilus assembly protein FimT|nr:hypothetical protein [Bacteriovoracaceae bacterium]
MLISVAKTSNRHQKFSLNKLGHKGFSILEILMALMLLVVIFTLVPMAIQDSEREKIQESLSKFDRALRFATSESVLRNTLVRLKINLDTNPVEYIVEYGQSANMVLAEAVDLSKLSLKERELELEKQKKIDSQFQSTDEFEESSATLPEGISIYGVATSYYPEIMTEGEVSIYLYPTGEKDSAIILLYSNEEMVSLDIPPFEERTFDNYYPFSENELVNFEYTLESKAKDIVEKWQKD